MTRAWAGGADAGFTLIEALVAMAVLAAGAVTLLTAVERHAVLARGLGDRTVARWVAETRLTELSLGLPVADGTVAAMGADWQVATVTAETADPDLARVDISVAGAGEDAPGVQLTGFVDARALAAGYAR